MTRLVPLTVLVVVLAVSGVANADKGTLPNSAVLSFDKLYIHEDGGSFKEPSDPDARRYYFNRAHCVCSKANAGKETTFQYLMKLTNVTNTHRPAELWVGTTCDAAAVPDTKVCRKLTSPTLGDIDTVASTETRLEFSLYDVIVGYNTGADCPTDETDKPVFLLVDTLAAGTFDYSLIKNIGQATGETVIGVDTNPPPLPTDFSAEPSESGVVVSWTVPVSRANDLYYYQALCSNADGSVTRSNPPAPRYRTAFNLCQRASDDPVLVPYNVDGTTGSMTSLPTGLMTLDPAYVCGETSGTADSISIDGLTNGLPYNVVVVATDLHGNYSGAYFTSTITPQPATDIWEDLHDRGSKAEGGFCLLAETYGDDSFLTTALRAFRDDNLGGSASGRWLTQAYYTSLAKLGVYVHGTKWLQLISAVLLMPLVAVALLWHWLTLPGMLVVVAAGLLWRRHHRWIPRILATRPLRVATGLMIVLLGASHAHAGNGYQPYWEDNDPTKEENQPLAGDPDLIKWHVGVRVGPYRPDIDKQFGMEPGPYEQMYKGIQVLPMLDVDRVLWTGFGQIAVGGSIGYTQKTGRSFVDGSLAGDPMRARSRGDRNAFRLIPLELTAAYRFTWLDDEYGIPVVPYIRGGLAYYAWFVSAKGDNVCKNGGDPPCDLNKPRGGSAGLTGAIGLAIRAERIDASTAMSMRTSGLQHAGIYGELSIAKVDGFGSDTKLSVGDRTWFAGVDFEF